MSRGPQALRACRAAAGHALLGAGAQVLLALSTVAQAAEATTPAVASPVSVLSLLQVLFALLIVLAAIGAFAWLMRRFGPGHGSAGGLLRVVGGVMVGPKERLVVVEVGETWLLLGVAGSSVTLVHSMPKPPHAAPAAQPGPSGAFQRLLGQALGRARPGS
jgi:flagellar protein FliO/FliZ